MTHSIALLPRSFKPIYLFPVLTRDDRTVELLCTTEPLSDGRQVIGIVTNADGSRDVRTWFANGAYYIRGEHPLDLFNELAKDRQP